MCTYLAKRGSVYYFRRSIPANVRLAFGGRGEFLISLRTKDRAEAKRLIPVKLIDTERLLADALGPTRGKAASIAERQDATALAACMKPTAMQKVTNPEPASDRVQSDSRSRDDRPVSMLDTAVVDGWAAERRPVQKGIDTHRAVARWFYERVGRKPVATITRADVLSFKTKLIDEGTTAANIRVKLSRLRTLLQWAADNDFAPENVAKGITIKDAAQAKNRRREFDLDSLRRIFASPVFADGARPAGGKGEAAYWLPMLALYTGARLEELGQLRAKDIFKHSYVDDEGRDRQSWFIRITADEEAGLCLKNASSERIIPLHSTLLKFGILKLLDTCSREDDRLFNKLRPNVYGRLTAKWGEWFSQYLRDTCNISDRRLVFHSFRHTFKHYARHVGIAEGIQRQIMGHSSSDAADHYGSGYTAWQMVKGMELYAVPGLTFVSAIPG